MTAHQAECWVEVVADRNPTHYLAPDFRDQKRFRNLSLGQTHALANTFHSVQKIGPFHVGVIAVEELKAFTCEFFMSTRYLLQIVKGEAAKFHDNRH